MCRNTTRRSGSTTLLGDSAGHHLYVPDAGLTSGAVTLVVTLPPVSYVKMSRDEWLAFLRAPVRPAMLATTRAVGQPHLVPIWYDVDDDGSILFNTGATSVKGRNMRRDARVALCVQDDQPPASFLGPTPFGTDCQRTTATGDPTGHSKISVVEVPLHDAGSAQVVAEPHIPLSDFRGTPGYRGCHDIGAFVEPGLAAAACLEEGQIWDISDPLQPVVLHRIDEPEVDIYHSGAFSYDAEVAVFGDEFEGGLGVGCSTPESTVGRAWFHDVETGTLLSSFMIPRAQGDEICTVHNYNVIPVRNRNILVSAWNLGGTSVIDFTEPTNPQEIGYVDVQENFDGRGPWSSYWYNGSIYVSDRGRGLDVERLTDRASAGAKQFPYLNAQTQGDLID